MFRDSLEARDLNQTGVVINPRGTSGAGKTELVRRIMGCYGGLRGGAAQPVYRGGRNRPICYRFRHPRGGRPLVVLGHYEVTSGGCDTVSGLDEVFELARGYAADGHDVLFEGLRVSSEFQRSALLAQQCPVHILRLRTPVEKCVQQVVARRRARKAIRPWISMNTAAENERVEAACAELRLCAEVHALSFEDALLRAGQLLGLEGTHGHI